MGTTHDDYLEMPNRPTIDIEGNWTSEPPIGGQRGLARAGFPSKRSAAWVSEVPNYADLDIPNGPVLLEWCDYRTSDSSFDSDLSRDVLHPDHNAYQLRIDYEAEQFILSMWHQKRWQPYIFKHSPDNPPLDPTKVVYQHITLLCDFHGIEERPLESRE